MTERLYGATPVRCALGLRADSAVVRLDFPDSVIAPEKRHEKVRAFVLPSALTGARKFLRQELPQGVVIATNDTNREALIHALGEYSRQLDYFVSFLEGYDEEFLALLRSAAENIKSALERLDSLKND